MSQPSVTVRIPADLQRYCEGEAELKLSGETVGQVLESVVDAFPNLRARIFDQRGDVFPYLTTIRNGDMLAPENHTAQRVKHGDTLELFSVASGG